MIERKTALITGAASGIGLATTRRFEADRRYHIYAADMSPTVHTIFDASTHPRVTPAQFDVRRGEQTANLFDKIRDETLKRDLTLDVVVNAAGVIVAGEPVDHMVYGEDSPRGQQIKNLYDTNFFGQEYIMEWATTMMECQGGGTIINITTSKDCFPDPYRLEYLESKQHFEAMSMLQAEHLREDGVRIVIAKPGNTKTNIDHGAWVDGSDKATMNAVQGFNDWWRNTFGSDPRKVANELYRIAEGKNQKDVAFIGIDAKLGEVLTKVVPYWREIFFMSSSLVYQAARLRNNLNSSIPASSK